MRIRGCSNRGLKLSKPLIRVFGCMLERHIRQRVWIDEMQFRFISAAEIVSEYDQEIPQSQTADIPVTPRGRAAKPSRDTRKTNKAKQSALSSPSR